VKVRKSRWDEEVEILREEMQCVLRYLQWETARWEGLHDNAGGHSDITNDIRDGLTAYAARHRVLHQELYLLFQQEMGLLLEEATSSIIASTPDDEEVTLKSLFA
jgi:hypothetical protein